MSYLKEWTPDQHKFWHRHAHLAYRNMWLSSFALIGGFAVWMQWSVLSLQMLLLGFPFSSSQLFSLTAIAGLSGAMLRLPASFVVKLYGGKAATIVMLGLLLIPAIGTAMALRSITTPLLTFQLLALLSGFGGALFSVTMASVSQFFPQHQQGFALGLHAGIGNLGIVLVQMIAPLAASFGALQWFGPAGVQWLQVPSHHLLGYAEAGEPRWLQNTSSVWIWWLLIALVLVWRKLDRLGVQRSSLAAARSYELPPQPWWAALLGMLTLMAVGILISALALFLMLPQASNGSGLMLAKELVLIGGLIATLFVLPRIPMLGARLAPQFSIFNNKHTWLLALMYTMSFGTLIGFAAAFPLVVQFIFGFTHQFADGQVVSIINPNGPNVLMYGWLGPLVGILARPLGGWFADQAGGARVTQWCAGTLVLTSLACAVVIHQAFASATPEDYFIPFFLLTLIIFAASGLANGSAFRSVAAVFPRVQAGTAIGWVSAIGALGAFYIPQTLGEHIHAGTPASALIGFAIFYLLCFVVNQFFYLSRQSDHYNP